MGLDITAYGRLQLVTHPHRDAEGNLLEHYFVAHSAAWTEKHFPGRIGDIVPSGIYIPSDRFSFHAGTYSGYNRWRDWLARLAGFESARAIWEADPPILTGPFVELIDFADDEGIIGAAVAKKLAADFREFRKAAEKQLPEEPFYLSRYIAWQCAFEIASDRGAVDFH